MSEVAKNEAEVRQTNTAWLRIDRGQKQTLTHEVQEQMMLRRDVEKERGLLQTSLRESAEEAGDTEEGERHGGGRKRLETRRRSGRCQRHGGGRKMPETRRVDEERTMHESMEGGRRAEDA